MAEYVLTATKTQARAGSFYDRIERVYDLTFKVNGYGKSLDQYFEQHPLPVSDNARVLDAGCGTGTLTLALLRNLRVPVKLTAIDLSSSVISTARKYVSKENPNQQDVRFTQGNVLALPFPDETFDVVVTCGVLEYLPLEEGFAELARVIAPGGYFLHLPMRPAPTTQVAGITLPVQDSSARRTLRTLTDRHFRSRQPLPLPAISGYRLEQDRGAGAQDLGTQACVSSHDRREDLSLVSPPHGRASDTRRHDTISPAPTSESDRHQRPAFPVHHDSNSKSK